MTRDGYDYYLNYRDILKFISNMEEFTIADIVTATGVSGSTVYSAIRNLIKKKKVKITKHVQIGTKGNRTKKYLLVEDAL